MAQSVSKHLIIAKYKEPVEKWLHLVPSDWTRTIITKGKDIPNEGREGSTFLYAICNLYDTLEDNDLVACVQGDPLPHTKPENFTAALNRGTDKFSWIGDYRNLCDAAGCPDHPGLPIGKFYTQMTGKLMEPKQMIEFHNGGEFIVTGKAIRARDKQDYQVIYI